jgi:succinate dehydrogenase / fumarate reductase cytochrome b subunit
LPVPRPASFLNKHEFLIRRLHSLSGLIPVGAYMCVHLVTNSLILNGPSAFQRAVNQIHSLGRFLWVVEWTFIFLPILFHMVVGIWIAVGARPNTSAYPRASNVRYTMQRVTAWIATVFILWHVFHMHGWFHWDWWSDLVTRSSAADPNQRLGGLFDPEHAASSAAVALGSWAQKGFYLVGVLASVYHFANGLWTMGITWGVWTSPAAQRRASLFAGAVGVVLAVIGVSALFGMGSVNVEAARKIEDRMSETRELAEQAAPVQP